MKSARVVALLFCAGALFVQINMAASARESESLAATWYVGPIFFYGVFTFVFAQKARFEEGCTSNFLAPLGQGFIGALFGLLAVAFFHWKIWPLL